MISFFLETSFKFYNKKLLFSWINTLITNENFILGEINIIYCDDKYLFIINKKYLNHDYYTDVITFSNIINTIISGDIFISINRVKENALKWGVSFEKELYRVINHGILHLLYYNDRYYNDKLIMQYKENFYLDLLFFKLKNVL